MPRGFVVKMEDSGGVSRLFRAGSGRPGEDGGGEDRNFASWLGRAIAEAYAAGYLGPDACGTGIQFDIYTQPGAGAYVCGACSHSCC